MKARTLIVAAILAGSSSALQARDYGSGDLAVARAFFWFNAARSGQTFTRDDVEAGARYMVRYCAETPASQIPRADLQTCEAFDDFKAEYARPASRETIESVIRQAGSSKVKDTKEAAPPHDKETLVPHPDPGSISLCPPPHRMTRDGCQ